MNKAFVMNWVYHCVLEPDQNDIQWKLAVSVPNKKLCRGEEVKRFIDWLRAKLCKDVERDAILDKSPDYQVRYAMICPTAQDGGHIISEVYSHELFHISP